MAFEVRFRTDKEALSYPPAPEDNDITVDLEQAPCVVNIHLGGGQATLCFHKHEDTLFVFGKDLHKVTKADTCPICGSGLLREPALPVAASCQFPPWEFFQENGNES